MSNKKHTKSYQFVISEPKKKQSKTKSNIKKNLKKIELPTKPEWTFSLFNFILKGENDNGENN